MSSKEHVKAWKKVLFFLFGLILVYFIGGFILNYFCYNKTIIHIWQSPPWETIAKAIVRSRTTKNLTVRTKLLEYTLLCEVIPIFIYIFFFLYIVGLKKKIHPNSEDERETLKGSAKWGKEKEYQGVYVFDWEPYNKLPPVILGQTYDAELDTSDPNDIITKKLGSKVVGCDPRKLNIMTMGGIGSLKGVSTIVPTLFSYKDSVIVYDPAKENFNITAGYRQSLGRVQFFDPTDINSTLHFNALEWIRRDRNYITADIDNICAILIPQNTKDRFFSQNARYLLSIYISYVILFFPKNRQNLKEVTSLTTILSRESRFHYKNVKRRLVYLKKQLEKEKWKNKRNEIIRNINYWDKYLNSIDKATMKAMDAEWEKEKDGSMISFINRLINDIHIAMNYVDQDDPDKDWKNVLLERTYATALKMKITAAAEQTIGGIEGEITSNMQFFSESGIANLTKDTSFEIEDINRREEPLSLYLCISNADTERCKIFVKLFISCLLKQLTTDYTQKRTHHTLFILDEFPQLGRIDEIVFAVPFVRKYGISFLFIFQSISQLESEQCYGKTDLKSIRGNTKILDVKQVGDADDASWLSKQLGNRTVILENESKSIKKDGKNDGKNISFMTESRALMNETEVTQMKPDESILVIGQSKPLKIKKFQYFAHPYFQMIMNKPYDYNIEQEKINLAKLKENEEDEIVDITLPAIPQISNDEVEAIKENNLGKQIDIGDKKMKINVDDIII